MLRRVFRLGPGVLDCERGRQELVNIRAQLLAALAILALGLGMAACGEEGEEVATPTLTATATPQPTVSPTPSPATAACVAGCIERLLDIQRSAPFRVYCPTFLPPDLAFLGAEYGGGVWVPLIEPITLEATFVDAAGTRKVRLIQGRIDLDIILPWFTPTGATIMYGDLQAQVWESRPEALFEPLLMAVAISGDGFTYWVDAHGVSGEELEQIAAGMEPLIP